MTHKIKLKKEDREFLEDFIKKGNKSTSNSSSSRFAFS